MPESYELESCVRFKWSDLDASLICSTLVCEAKLTTVRVQEELTRVAQQTCEV